MALPKRRHSRSRSRKRRAHLKLRGPQLRPCPQCRRLIFSHRVCPYCGYYKGEALIQIKSKEKKKKR